MADIIHKCELILQEYCILNLLFIYLIYNPTETEARLKLKKKPVEHIQSLKLGKQSI